MDQDATRMDGTSGPKGSLEAEIERAWRENSPETVRSLEARGTLNRLVNNAAERTREAHAELIAQGVDFHDGWEMLRSEWAFPKESEAQQTPLEEALSQYQSPSPE